MPYHNSHFILLPSDTYLTVLELTMLPLNARQQDKCHLVEYIQKS